jgi:ATP-dependent Zn protease
LKSPYLTSEQLNAQLLAINNQIMQTAKQSQTSYQTSQQQTDQQDQILQQNYKALTEQRADIHRMMRSYENLDAAYEDGNINVTSHYYTYIVLLFITILLAFLLVKFSVTGKQMGGGGSNFKNEALFLLGIMVSFLIISKLLKKIHSFNFIAIILIAYLVAKIKLNQ